MKKLTYLLRLGCLCWTIFHWSLIEAAVPAKDLSRPFNYHQVQFLRQKIINFYRQALPPVTQRTVLQWRSLMPTAYGQAAQQLCTNDIWGIETLENLCQMDSDNANKNMPRSVQEELARLVKSPAQLQRLAAGIKKFCPRSDLSNAAKSACTDFQSQLDAYHRQERLLLEDPHQTILKGQQQQQSQAAGILESCQSHQKSAGGGLLSSLTADSQDIISPMQLMPETYCQSQESVNLPCDEVPFKQISDSFEQIEEEVLPLEVLKEGNIHALDGAIGSYLLGTLQYRNAISPAEMENNLRRKFPDFFKLPHFKDLIKNNIEKFHLLGKQVTFGPNYPGTILQDLSQLGGELNSLCQQIKENYKSVADKGTVLNSEEENKFYQQEQDKLRKVYHRFLQENPHGKLLATSTMQKEFLPFHGNVAEQCAEGDIDYVFNNQMNETDAQNAINDFFSMMDEELKQVQRRQESIATILGSKKDTSDKIKDEIKDLIKYRPYTLVQQLKNLENSPVAQDQLATYLCKLALEIYDNNEQWNLLQLTLGGLTLTAALTVNLIPGVGQVLSAGIMSTMGTIATAGVFGTEGYMAYRRYHHSAQTIDSIHLASALGQGDSWDSERLSEQQEQKNWSYLQAGLLIVGGAAAPVVSSTVRPLVKAPSVVVAASAVNTKLANLRPIQMPIASSKETIYSATENLLFANKRTFPKGNDFSKYKVLAGPEGKLYDHLGELIAPDPKKFYAIYLINPEGQLLLQILPKSEKIRRGVYHHLALSANQKARYAGEIEFDSTGAIARINNRSNLFRQKAEGEFLDNYFRENGINLPANAIKVQDFTGADAAIVPASAIYVD